VNDLRGIDSLAVNAKSDEQVMRQFIADHHAFIIKKASITLKKKVTTHDDAWSIALGAFLEAVQDYSYEKGSFLSFAELVIRRKCIDFMRSQFKYQQEFLVNPSSFDGEQEENEFSYMHQVIARKASQSTQDDLKLEIEAANAIFQEYGFRFFDLADCSPKAHKTKYCCAQIIAYLLKNPVLLQELHISKQLPIKILEKNTKVPRKIIERHRKYIIAACEILSGEFPYLSEFLRYIREELRR
jgi:RNA polymerase sigma factor